MNTRGQRTAIFTLTILAFFAATPGHPEERRPAEQTPAQYRDLIDAVRAQRQAQMEERRRAMREAADSRRQLGEARRQSLNELPMGHPPAAVPSADEQQPQWPGGVIPPYWDNAWYYRGY
jgi:hypothetical protein